MRTAAAITVTMTMTVAMCITATLNSSSSGSALNLLRSNRTLLKYPFPLISVHTRQRPGYDSITPNSKLLIQINVSQHQTSFTEEDCFKSNLTSTFLFIKVS